MTSLFYFDINRNLDYIDLTLTLEEKGIRNVSRREV